MRTRMLADHVFVRRTSVARAEKRLAVARS